MSAFKALRHDFPASIVVFLIAIPLSLGIAAASGAPLLAGLIAAVVGGVVAGALLAGHRPPNQHRYPGVKIAACQLAADHPGECEMFVDGEGGINGEPYQGLWLTWYHRSPYDELQSSYRWIRRPDCCPVKSPTGWHCNRYANHLGGHAFNVEP